MSSLQPSSVWHDFPLELQDEIFECAARESTEAAAMLVQVSSGVGKRILPILYQTVVFKDEWLGDVQTRFDPPHIEKWSENEDTTLQRFEIYGCYITSLAIKPQWWKVIESCISLKNLYIPGKSPSKMLFTIHNCLPDLERLSWTFRGVQSSSDTISNNGLCEKLTHLHLVEDHSWEVVSTILTCLRGLTHLAVDDSWFEGEDSNEIVREALKVCPGLQVVLLVWRKSDLSEICKEEVYEPRDRKVVAVAVRSVLEDWLAGVHGELDMWSLADSIIKQRKICEI
ncbi:hypothetical protein BDN72DRAFT_897238 [Pluteus cervinus]|uniref:Uncharacterized protein n=1 Tax=Pluteus cervinus TaxID=181527 RepID=A0ACD3AUL1_9AGAR|nr:hypothetical protein BDN72DRAFT_897238 [Pluteus cervinus]